VCLAIESPASHLLSHPPQGIITGSRQEAREELVMLAVSLPRPEREAQEGEAHMRMLLGAVAVLAVHNLRLVRMHRQPLLRTKTPCLVLELFSLNRLGPVQPAEGQQLGPLTKFSLDWSPFAQVPMDQQFTISCRNR